MTSTKFKSVLDKSEDEDFDDDDDSGSDFDDDEDPDKIEVPGGGRDLQTALTYAKNVNRSNSTINNNTNINNNNINNNNNSLLKINQSSALTGSAGILRLNTSAATAASSSASSIGGSGKFLPSTIKAPTSATAAITNYNNTMPKKLNNPATATTTNTAIATSMNNAMPTTSTTAAAAAIATLAGGSGSGSGAIVGLSSTAAGNYLNSLSTGELMSLAAYVAAKGGSASMLSGSGGSGGGGGGIASATQAGSVSTPPPPQLANALAAIAAGNLNNSVSNTGGNTGFYQQANSSYNMAASILAQMSMGYAGGASSMPSSRAGVGVPTTTANTATTRNPQMNTSMLEKLQSLLAANPEYLTSGIPNQVMTQLLVPQMQPLMGNSMSGHSVAGVGHVPPEDEEADYEEMGVAETYAEYWPAKLKLGKKHPDPVVETASLSSVEPSNVYYKLSIPGDTINSGQLSALQLESITYASQAHDHFLPDGSRAGFLIGDGAGVGKGRTIAGIIYENYLKGRKKALWISVSNDLKYDAERDLSDIGASKIEVHALNKFKYAKISSDVNNNCKRGVIFSTYSALIGESNNKSGKYRSRFRQLLQWCGEDFEGLIIFDECHKAKNLCPVGSGKPTKTGQTVLELQNKLPKARVVYASATGASEPKNMAYMVRLGLWGQGSAFNTFNDFITAVEKRGVGAMEIVAMDMKLRGMYIARQLSFKGVTFKIEEVALSKEFRKIYDQSVALWVEAMQKFTEAAELIDAESRMRKTMWGQFWSSHQRFFKYLCIAAKVHHAVNVAREAIKYGKCVVIGLQSTGEARTLEQLEKDDGELNDFVSTAKGVFQSFVERHFPAPDRSRINRILGICDENEDEIDKKSSVKTENNDGGGNGNGNASGNGSGGGSGSGNTHNNNNKRKSTMEARSAANKKSRSSNATNSNNNTHSDDDADNNNDADSDGNAVDEDEDSPFGGDDSDYKNSNSESDLSDSTDNDDGVGDASDGSSDYNPFPSGSDSEIDPWVNARAKKPKKKKKKTKEQRNNNSKYATTTTATATATTAQTAKQQTKKTTQSTQDKIQYLLQKKQEMKGTVTQIGVNGMKMNYGPPPKNAIERACYMKEELLRKIERLGAHLPPNTLDQLIDELGGPENVAEMTGRRGRVVQMDDGSIQYESRTEQDVPLETLNITEKQRFMSNEKDVAIISEAASSGISLQSDRRVLNQRRRVHITLELPWSADRAIQQFGRTHRSNQVNAPEYIFLISDLAGERRFASTVAKRLESLGALTHGDRRATETRDLSQFNIDNKYGRAALETVMKTIMGYEAPLVPPPNDYNGEFFKDVAGALVGVGLIVNSETNPGILSLDKDYNNISKFLNRILGCPVELQNRLFKYFTDTMTAIINQAKRGGRFDLGIVDLGAAGENVTRVKLIRFMRKHATGIAPTELHTVRVERGMIWQEAMEKYDDLYNKYDGFYISHQVRNNKRTAILAVEIEAVATPQQQQQQQQQQPNDTPKKEKSKNKKDIMFQIYRPNTGLQVRHESLAEIEKKYKKVSSEGAEKYWSEQYDSSVLTCSHAYWNGNCRNVAMGNDCQVGLRQRLYHVLAGSVLSVWTRVEHILSSRNANHKMQVIRMKTTEGEKIVGTLIPKSCYELLIKDLAHDSLKKEEIRF